MEVECEEVEIGIGVDEIIYHSDIEVLIISNNNIYLAKINDIKKSMKLIVSF